MRFLVTGARGLLGAAIVREFSRDSEVVALDRAALDITDDAAVERAVSDARPDVIVNCSAYNDVDGAETDAASAIAVNAMGVLALSGAAASRGIPLVHFGTDFVFDGAASLPYTEDDAPKPRSFYGLSKLLGEWFALENPRAYVLRVESLFGEPAPGAAPRGSLWTIASRIRAGDEVTVFVDRTVTPAYTGDIAQAVRRLLERGAPGLYHCVNSGSATWAAVAEETARILGRPLHARHITQDAAGLKAARPRFCALSNAKLAAAGVPMPSWQDALARYLDLADRR